MLCRMLLVLVLVVLTAAPAPAVTTLWLSVDPHGGAADSDCSDPHFSGDGRYVAFVSFAANLVPSHPAGDLLTADVFVRDLVTGVTEQVNMNDWGMPGPLYVRASVGPAVPTWGDVSVSGDGRYVAFWSGTGLDPADANAADDVFVRDRLTGHTTRVSVSSAGGLANAGSGAPALSADGRYVAFLSAASNLVAGDTNEAPDVFVHDMVAGTTERVSISDSGGEGWAGDLGTAYGPPTISADGRLMVFASSREGLALGDANADTMDALVRDRVAGTTRLVNVNTAGEQSDAGDTLNPALSSDGRYAVFSNAALNLDPRVTDRQVEVYLRDLLVGTTELVSLSADGGQASNRCEYPVVTPGGRFVAFASLGYNLVPNDTNHIQDVFLRDRLAGATARVSISWRGEEADGSLGDNAFSGWPSLSDDGSCVAFVSNCPNLAPRPTGTTFHVYAWDSLARFPDVPHVFWAFSGIEACANAGIVNGYPDGQYWPADPVDRAQMAVYMTRALCGGESGVPPYSGASPFPDVEATAYTWALPHIVYLKDAGIVSGYPDGGYHPAETVTRAQMAAYVARSRGWIPLEGPMNTAPELFPDVPAGYWAGTAIEACKDHGVVAGYWDGYHPEEAVTRGQMAVYVQRGFGLSTATA